MNGETLYKGSISRIDDNLNAKAVQTIIYRLININNTYFFAEEITTGCIFPIYNFSFSSEETKKHVRFQTFSYLRTGAYFVYFPITGSKDIFKYSISEDKVNFANAPTPSIKEVNHYLNIYTRDSDRKEMIKLMEISNNYMCDIKLIKEKINLLKENNTMSFFNQDVVQTEYEEYKPKLDIKEISEFGYDLSTKEKLCNLVERDEEIKKLIKTICIKEKSILLVGPPGSGKTALVEYLAKEIKSKNNNKWLKNKLIFYVNISNIISGTKFRGDFEEKFQKLIDFCVKHKREIILFIDEIHMLYGLGRTIDSTIDAMNILKPYLSSGEFPIIGTTTNEEHKKYMANDPAFLERFDTLYLTAISEELNTKILLSYIKELEKKYNIELNLSDNQKQETTTHIINITDKKNQRVVGDTVKLSNPRISKTIIEDAFAEALFLEKDNVGIEDICFAITSCNKLNPVFRNEKADELKTTITNKSITKKKILDFPKIN